MNTTGVERPQRIHIAAIADFEERRAAFDAGQRIISPAGWIITVDILGDDIEITAKNNRNLILKQLLGAGIKPFHPGQLVVEFRSRRRIAVRQIDAGHTGAGDRCLDIARLFVIRIAGQAAHHILDGVAADDGNAIVAFLPMHGDMPGLVNEQIAWKIFGL